MSIQFMSIYTCYNTISVIIATTIAILFVMVRALCGGFNHCKRAKQNFNEKFVFSFIPFSHKGSGLPTATCLIIFHKLYLFMFMFVSSTIHGYIIWISKYRLRVSTHGTLLSLYVPYIHVISQSGVRGRRK